MEWVKIYTNGWLRGSIRAQLTPAERSVWADLIALAGENRKDERRGIVEIAKGIPYTREKLASVLDIPVDLLNSTIEKCVKDENADNPTTRLVIMDDGALQIGNFDYYQKVPERINRKREAEKNAKAENSKKGRIKDSLIERMLEAINARNKIDANLRYVLTPDCHVLDIRTGEIKSYEDFIK